ncbi:DUF3100 domain-containing protein [Microbacterium sp. No. 7]|uniref:DUF3100 domain-containing protein n=1 Tax=Microbacterium sp. No. 7 TaxID=1714373 RepID=UPI0006CFC4BF|nr:DUF3100 domain-containing protein [Microbacterium sp. No. 7]ALJ18650.1 hypothetical protein AOA12_01455 [Microbacterium sp. No. 7]
MDDTSRTTAPLEPTAQRTFAITIRDKGFWLLVGLMTLIAVIAQSIGPIRIPLGSASIDLLPMIWAVLIALIVSGQRWKPLPVDLQHSANVMVSVAVLLLVARMSLTMGPNIPTIIAAGPALLLQELGNLFGPILLALPLAVLLRMGPATVGATFSIDREASFAMVVDRFGSNSPQYRGVLSMYVFGSVFGAIIVSIIASLTSSLGIFDWRALAMGAGVGSGSMMAAGVGAVTAAHPEATDEIAALATTANLIAGLAGVYIGVLVSLPLADRFYRLLTRRRRTEDAAKPSGTLGTSQAAAVAAAVLDVPKVTLPLWNSLLVLCGASLVVVIVATRSFSWNMVITLGILAAFVAAGIGLSKLARGKLPAIIVVITLGMLLTSPISPVAGWLVEVSSSVDFLAMITVMLAIAGLSMGKDLPMLRQIGWKIIPVGIVVIGATFLTSTVIAEFVLRAIA